MALVLLERGRRTTRLLRDGAQAATGYPVMNLPNIRTEWGTIRRFILVGILNTGIGYSFILLGLWAGAGDYLANIIGFCIGLPISYILHRSWTFRPQRSATVPELLRYLAAFLVSYGFNLGVVTAGRVAGYQESPIVHGIAICTYAAVFYFISRVAVFR